MLLVISLAHVDAKDTAKHKQKPRRTKSKKKKKKKKNVMSIESPPAILGPEMAAPILWAPGIFWFFLLENPHAHKIPPFRGGVLGFLFMGRGWKCQFHFYGDFSEFSRGHKGGVYPWAGVVFDASSHPQ